MLPKVAHYAGFQSYADLPYASLKPGRKELQTNTVYQETVRQGDSLQFYDNTNRYNTVYNNELSKTVQPVHYQNVHLVTKHEVERPLFATGKMTLTNTSSNSRRTFSSANGTRQENPELHNKGLQLLDQTMKSLKKEPTNENTQRYRAASSMQYERTARDDDYDYVQNGTEHWKSTYMAGIKDPYAYSKASRPEWTLHKAPHVVKNGPISSDYKIQFGERGDNPVEKLSMSKLVPPFLKSDENLKLGTTQATHHIPGYTGHMPKSVIHPEKWDHSLGVNTRNTTVKQNIVENYQTRIPGYNGHRPRNAVNDRGTMRNYCFSTAGETFC